MRVQTEVEQGLGLSHFALRQLRHFVNDRLHQVRGVADGGEADQARAALAPYEKAGKLKTFTDGDTLPLAAKAENANGHTIGHSAFRFNNGQGAALLVWGDLVHFPAIQFARPDASYSFDYDAAAGIASRQRLMQEAAEQHLTVAGAHLPFPGIGRVNKDNDGRAYHWRPVEYTPQ